MEPINLNFLNHHDGIGWINAGLDPAAFRGAFKAAKEYLGDKTMTSMTLEEVVAVAIINYQKGIME